MNYLDDNTPYVCSENVDAILKKLGELGKIVFERFLKKFLKCQMTNVILFQV